MNFHAPFSTIFTQFSGIWVRLILSLRGDKPGFSDNFWWITRDKGINPVSGIWVRLILSLRGEKPGFSDNFRWITRDKGINPVSGIWVVKKNI
ncbi:hypothetical protein [Microcoleus sp. PH2017_02_FOX_O_A]|uniref:hypothetical protein n=1 Tax=Microcoleus sp. PH2017_02_FOX_O_A TaxID=2798813 RepID=UPI001D85CB6F|nr:hypothetical protein [Microcoleus sp. PH2017_02_FOX_O_A]MCC3414434.1 hypothetical protein [Microcoleus sp. PH2017_02_FOX_O_A]